MASTSVPGILNIEALNEDNYKDWSFRVKTYLLAEDLWDLVEDIDEPPKLEGKLAEFKAWRRNNARALQAFTIFCGKDAESCIRGMEIARDAWNTLAEKFKIPEILDENSEVDSNGETSSTTDDDADLETDAVEAVSNETHHAFFREVENKDWEAVKEYVKQHPEALRAKHSDYGWTALQYSIMDSLVFSHDLGSIKELVQLMKNKDFDATDNDEHTAIYTAIRYGTHKEDVSIEIVKCIVEKNKKLLRQYVDSSSKTIPINLALSYDKPKLAHYLYSVTPIEKLKRKDQAEIVSTGLRMKYLDIPLDLLRLYPKLAIAQDHSGESPLNELASTRASLFKDVSNLRIWKRWIYKGIEIPELPPIRPHIGEIPIEENDDQDNREHIFCKVRCFGRLLVAKLRHIFGIDGLYEMKLLHVRTRKILKHVCEKVLVEKDSLNYMEQKFVVKAVFQAVERGHAPFISEILGDRYNRMLILSFTNQRHKTVFQFAAELRQNKIFDLMDRYYTSEELKEIVGRKDKFGNNMLHVVGKLSPLTQIAHVRGAALQMQNELQWFKKVERMASPRDLNSLNSSCLTPREVFTMSHRELVKEGQSAMKEIANSSSFVGALIITIMFTAAVTVPGGIKGDTGIPMYVDTKAFQIFVIAVIISLCCSTTSVLASLGILTSRFAEEDFLVSLPKKMIFGLLTLFVSIAGMMVAFSTAIFIMIPNKQSIIIPLIVLACVPVASFLWMEGKLLIEVTISTYNTGDYYLIKNFCFDVYVFFFKGPLFIGIKVIRHCFRKCICTRSSYIPTYIERGS